MRQTKFMVFPRVRLGRNYHSSVNQCVSTVVRARCHRGKTQWQLRSQALSLSSASLWRGPSDKGNRENLGTTVQWTAQPRIQGTVSAFSRSKKDPGTQQQATEMRVVGKTLLHSLCGLYKNSSESVSFLLSHGKKTPLWSTPHRLDTGSELIEHTRDFSWTQTNSSNRFFLQVY